MRIIKPFLQMPEYKICLFCFYRCFPFIKVNSMQLRAAKRARKPLATKAGFATVSEQRRKRTCDLVGLLTPVNEPNRLEAMLDPESEGDQGVIPMSASDKLATTLLRPKTE
jgi:hypothetical protein